MRLFLIIFMTFVFSLTFNGSRSEESLHAEQSGMLAEAEDTFTDPANRRILKMNEFIQLAAEKDSEFEAILIDALTLKYRKMIGLPAGDLVFSIKNDYSYFPRQNRGERGMDVSLSKLFPFTGTEIEATYTSSPSFTRRENSSEMNLMISQPIAENAFGRATRLRDKILGTEIDVIRHQIIEAYEDYLALIMKAYIAWYSAYENLKIGESSYRENLKLQENMEKRLKSNIALPIDVNKITLQVLAKKETVIDLRTDYDNALNFIEKSIRYEGTEELVPAKPAFDSGLEILFERDYANFETESRTFQILKLLEKRSGLSVKEEWDDLLPSIKLQLGTNWSWSGFAAEREDHMLYGAVTMDWSIFETVDRGEYQTAKIVADKSKLETTNTLLELYVNLKNLHSQITNQRKLFKIAEEKIKRARSVLDDESENYSYGKVTLNDYIQAVNTYDTNRFNSIRREVTVDTLAVEWFRLSDQLVEQDEMDFPS